MMTYDALMKKLFEGDPIADPDFPERTTLGDDGITVLGGPDKPPSMSVINDLHIAIQGDKLIYGGVTMRLRPETIFFTDRTGQSRLPSMISKRCTRGSMRCEEKP